MNFGKVIFGLAILGIGISVIHFRSIRFGSQKTGRQDLGLHKLIVIDEAGRYQDGRMREYIEHRLMNERSVYFSMLQSPNSLIKHPNVDI